MNALRLVRDKVVAGIFDLDQLEKEDIQNNEQIEVQEREKEI
jgi:hypothetical protein